jgi:polyhydroxybutyrate depolymerase
MRTSVLLRVAGPVAFAVALPISGSGCSPCGTGRDCKIVEGSYRVILPAGWDDTEDLPLLIHAHGWHGAPEQYLDDPAVQDSLDQAGVILALPRGEDTTWTVPNSGIAGSGRDDQVFLLGVLADVEDRWSVDSSRVYLSGFSLGASLISSLACAYPDRFAAASPMSGGFWDPQPTDCGTTPIPVCRIHGLHDLTWPVEGGREVAAGTDPAVQHSAESDAQMWRDHNSCGAEANDVVEAGALTCTRWMDCSGGTEVGLCTHEGGHERFEGWLDRELEWMLQFSR